MKNRTMLFKCIFLLFCGLNSLYSQTLIGDPILGTSAEDNFGESVSSSSNGNRIIAGAPDNSDNMVLAGYARVYEWDGTAWNQVGSTFEGTGIQEQLGTSVAMSADGNRVAVGARGFMVGNETVGAVKIYNFDGTDWIQVGNTIIGEESVFVAGSKISMNTSGSLVTIGDRFGGETGFNRGIVRVFELNAGTWTQVGATFNGENDGELLGESVSLNSAGDRLAIGIPGSDINGSISGLVEVYEFVGSEWIELGNGIPGEGPLNHSGSAVALSSDGNRVVIGENLNGETGEQAGQVRVFEYNGTNWVQVGGDLNGEAAFDLFGDAVTISEQGNIIAAGAWFNDGNGSAAGHTRIFREIAGEWIQWGPDIDGVNEGDGLGISLKLNAQGDQIAIGAFGSDDNGINSGQVRVYDLFGILNITIPETSIEFVIAQPSRKLIIISFSGMVRLNKVSLFNLNGQLINQYNLNRSGDLFDIHLDSLLQGLFLIRLDTESDSFYQKILFK